MHDDSKIFLAFIVYSILVTFVMNFTIAGKDGLSIILILLLTITIIVLMFRGLWSIKRRDDIIKWNKILTLDDDAL